MFAGGGGLPILDHFHRLIRAFDKAEQVEVFGRDRSGIGQRVPIDDFFPELAPKQQEGHAVHAAGLDQPAVLTSATLRSLGNFNTLQRETGVPDSAHFLSVAGAFDYAKAASLRVPSDAVEGNNVDDHTQHIVDNIESMVEKKAGTLVLFSSRRQMQQVHDELPNDLVKLILIQGQYSNREMVRLHKERIDQGSTSMLFGLASFAEGVDLPGDYCRHVVIAKLPFAVPNEPLQQALAEWIEARGGNSFFDISLPLASLRLIQACGRLLRTESDTGTVTILDKRLLTKRYGKQLLDALPPFRRELG